MVIIKSKPVVNWHRAAFKFYWRWKSIPKEGRPEISSEVINLIKAVANDNPLWEVPRIHGELCCFIYYLP
jgi:hypothetical protein